MDGGPTTEENHDTAEAPLVLDGWLPGVSRDAVGMDVEARWGTTRRLPHDDTLKPEDRLAGLLLLRYAQPDRLTLALPRRPARPTDQCLGYG